jgi:hypothetical protein
MAEAVAPRHARAMSTHGTATPQSEQTLKSIFVPSNVSSSPARTGGAKTIALAIHERAGSRPVQRQTVSKLILQLREWFKTALICV